MFGKEHFTFHLQYRKDPFGGNRVQYTIVHLSNIVSSPTKAQISVFSHHFWYSSIFGFEPFSPRTLLGCRRPTKIILPGAKNFGNSTPSNMVLSPTRAPISTPFPHFSSLEILVLDFSFNFYQNLKIIRTSLAIVCTNSEINQFDSGVHDGESWKWSFTKVEDEISTEKLKFRHCETS